MKQQLYRICWKNPITGASGHGTACLSKVDVDAWVTTMNAQYPTIMHWADLA